MKKILIITSSLISALIVALSCVTASAETYHIADGFKYMLVNDNAYIAGIVDDRTVLEVPASLNGHPVTATTMYFAEKNENLISATFENAENISIIGSYSFSECKNLTFVNLGSHVNELYRGVFRDCTSLETVELNDNLTEIPYECFYGCSSLGVVTLGKNITLIQENSFRGCDNLIIRCYYNSYANNFAISHNIPYILIDGPKTGDVNGDGNVDILDSTEIQKFAAEMIELTDEQFELADINDDGFVDVIDALLVQKYVVGKYDIPPIIYNS